MKTKIFTITTILFVIVACAPKQITIFKRHISSKTLKLVAFDNNITVADNVVIKITPDKKFKGFAGCNDYNGTYSLNRDYINFKIDTQGTKVCDNTYQEGIYIRNLVKSKKIIVQGKKIYFEDKNDKRLLTFKKITIKPKL